LEEIIRKVIQFGRVELSPDAIGMIGVDAGEGFPGLGGFIEVAEHPGSIISPFLHLHLFSLEEIHSVTDEASDRFVHEGVEVAFLLGKHGIEDTTGLSGGEVASGLLLEISEEGEGSLPQGKILKRGIDKSGFVLDISIGEFLGGHGFLMVVPD
jgi:hypothetical protein